MATDCDTWVREYRAHCVGEYTDNTGSRPLAQLVSVLVRLYKGKGTFSLHCTERAREDVV